MCYGGARRTHDQYIIVTYIYANISSLPVYIHFQLRPAYSLRIYCDYYCVCVNFSISTILGGDYTWNTQRERVKIFNSQRNPRRVNVNPFTVFCNSKDMYFIFLDFYYSPTLYSILVKCAHVYCCMWIFLSQPYLGLYIRNIQRES